MTRRREPVTVRERVGAWLGYVRLLPSALGLGTNVGPVPKFKDLPPRGHYHAAEVGQLAGVSGQKIGQWEHYGYIKASQPSKGYPLVYSFQDVAEAMVVHELVLVDVPMADIRATVKNLRKEYGDWPLAKAPLHAGGGFVAIQAGEALIDTGRMHGQALILEPKDLERVATALTRGGWAVRDMPDLEYIEVNPDRLSGRPAIRGHRVGAEQVARLAVEPGGVETLHEDYELNDAEISDARRWWSRVQEYEAAA